MTLEEKFKALIKNCETMNATNEELINQNAYLKHQLSDFMRQKRKAAASSHSSSSPGSAQEEEREKHNHHFASFGEEEPYRTTK